MTSADDRRPLRVLMLSPSAQLGGAERMLLDILGSLRDAIDAGEVGVHVMTLSDGPLVLAARSAGATVHVAGMPKSVAQLGDFGGANLPRIGRAIPGIVRLARSMRRIAREVQPDVIHSNGAKTHLLGALCLNRAPLVWHVHDLVGRRPMLARGMRWLSRRASFAIGVSESVAADLRTVVPAVPIVTLLNAIDVDHFTPCGADSTIIKAPPDAVRVGLIATYARWKGQDLFLRAVGELAKANANTPMRFYIVGGPIYQTRGSQFARGELMALADELGVRGVVEFIDFVPDPAPVYRALDVVVHASSLPEPFGRTIVEAMACGRAVIASVGGGAGEVIRDGVDAIGVRPGDVKALASAIARLAGDATLRDRLGVAARESAVRRFDRRRLGPALLTIYRDVLAKQASGVRQAFGECAVHSPPDSLREAAKRSNLLDARNIGLEDARSPHFSAQDGSTQ